MYNIIKTDHKPILAWNKQVAVHEQAIAQAANMSSLPFVYKHVVLMPDAQPDTGTPKGSVLATSRAVLPAAVGTDIGCGSMAYHTNIKAAHLPDNVDKICQDIAKVVPCHDGKTKKSGIWHRPPSEAVEIWIAKLGQSYHTIIAKHPDLDKGNSSSMCYQELGTLGAENSFVQLCTDEKDNLWLTLRAGSRSLGTVVGTYFMDKAQDFAKINFIDYYLPDKDLAYLTKGNELFGDYTEAMLFAQEFAKENRMFIMQNTLKALAKHLPKIKQTKIAVNHHHNYAEVEKINGKALWVSRKGAINVKKNAHCLITAKDKSCIVQGDGSPFSFNSCASNSDTASMHGLLASQQELTTVKATLKTIATIKN